MNPTHLAHTLVARLLENTPDLEAQEPAPDLLQRFTQIKLRDAPHFIISPVYCNDVDRLNGPMERIRCVVSPETRQKYLVPRRGGYNIPVPVGSNWHIHHLSPTALSALLDELEAQPNPSLDDYYEAATRHGRFLRRYYEAQPSSLTRRITEAGPPSGAAPNAQPKPEPTTIQPAESTPFQIRRHLEDNIFKHTHGEERFALIRLFAQINQHFKQNPTPFPKGKWWLPALDDGAFVGDGPYIRSYIPDAEAMPTDNQMLVNPMLPAADKRNWILKLKRTRPEDARKLLGEDLPTRLDFGGNVNDFTGMSAPPEDDVINQTLRTGTEDAKIRLLASLDADHPRLDEVWCAVFSGQHTPQGEATVIEDPTTPPPAA